MDETVGALSRSRHLTVALGLLYAILVATQAVAGPEHKGTTCECKKESLAVLSQINSYLSTEPPAGIKKTLAEILVQKGNIDTLLSAGKRKEAVPLARSTLSKMDSFLIQLLNAPNMTAYIPPDVVTQMRKNNAEPLCAYLSREVAKGPILANVTVKNLLTLRDNLKSTVASLR